MGYTIEIESAEGYGWEEYAKTKDEAIDLAVKLSKDPHHTSVEILDADGEVVGWQ
jgi:hypothetical protein